MKYMPTASATARGGKQHISQKVEALMALSALVLLVLQLGFLLPPFGYALMMVRGTLRYAGSLAVLTRALVPFLLLGAIPVSALSGGTSGVRII